MQTIFENEREPLPKSRSQDSVEGPFPKSQLCELLPGAEDDFELEKSRPYDSAWPWKRPPFSG